MRARCTPKHCQGRGVGAALVRTALARAEEPECPIVLLEDDPGHYARFGFVEATLPFRKPSLRVPDPAFPCVLLAAYERWMTDTLVYPEIFWRHDAVGLRDPNRSPEIDPPYPATFGRGLRSRAVRP